MITLLIVLASLAAYFGIGYRAAIWNIPLHEKAHYESWSYSLNVADKRLAAGAMLFFWPIYLPVRLIKHFLTGMIENHDPKEIARRAEAKVKEAEQKEIEHKKYITRLELDAGMELTYPEFDPDGPNKRIRELEREFFGLRYHVPSTFNDDF